MSVGPARSGSFGIGVGLSEEPMAGAVFLRMREGFRVEVGLGDLVVDVIPRSFLAVDDSGIWSSIELDPVSAIDDTGILSNAPSGVACRPN